MKVRFQFTHPGGVRRCCLWISSNKVTTFQFTHPGGVRPNTSSRRTAPAVFQFTHPGGVRPSCRATGGRLGSFNSRTREGCDTPRHT